jgi:hypothetical protein
MQLQAAIKHFGSQAKLARALGVSGAAVSDWARTGMFPIGRQYQVQVLTEGALKVGDGDAPAPDPAVRSARVDGSRLVVEYDRELSSVGDALAILRKDVAA